MKSPTSQDLMQVGTPAEISLGKMVHLDATGIVVAVHHVQKNGGTIQRPVQADNVARSRCRDLNICADLQPASDIPFKGDNPEGVLIGRSFGRQGQHASVAREGHRLARLGAFAGQGQELPSSLRIMDEDLRLALICANRVGGV